MIITPFTPSPAVFEIPVGFFEFFVYFFMAVLAAPNKMIHTLTSVALLK